MSYDLTIATSEEPSRQQIEAWAAEKGLVVNMEDGASSLIIEKSTGRGDRFVCNVDGPHSAEPDDFADEVAAACLAPRWMMQVSVPYSSAKVNFSHARSLARFLAEQNQGAAYDPQEDALIWPRGSGKRVPARTESEVTSSISLEWFLPPSRWDSAPERMLRAVRRLCPEALPTRYGQWEPLQHRFDPKRPDEFVRFVLETEDGDAFWFASRPSFGGSCFAPHAEKYAQPDEEPQRIAHLELDFDGGVIASDARWCDAVVDLFVTVAAETGAFFAAAQVEPGWIVSRNNRLSADAGTDSGEHFLRRRLWQGLPPVPVWLSWFGEPYRPLVADLLTQDSLERSISVAGPRAGLIRRLVDRSDAPLPVEPNVVERDEGLFLRLSNEPRPRAELPDLPIPVELTYRARPDVVHRDGSRESNPAQPEDRARLIPVLDR